MITTDTNPGYSPRVISTGTQICTHCLQPIFDYVSYYVPRKICKEKIVITTYIGPICKTCKDSIGKQNIKINSNTLT